MNTKSTLFVTGLAAALFGVGCASPFKDDLVAYYPFNGNAKDMSGNGNDGQAVGLKFIADRHGKLGKACEFDGVKNFVFIEHKTQINSNNITVVAWIKISQDTPKQVSILSGPNEDIFFGVSSNHHLRVSRTGPGSGHVESLSLLSSNIWHMVAMSYDGNILRFYLNGNLDGLKAAKFNLKPSVQKSIGSSKPDYDEEYFEGSIDDVRIYNRVLSDAEVKALYNLEKPTGR